MQLHCQLNSSFRLFLVILGRKRQLFNFSKGQVAWIAHVAPVRLFSFLRNPSSASATGENLFLQWSPSVGIKNREETELLCEVGWGSPCSGFLTVIKAVCNIARGDIPNKGRRRLGIYHQFIKSPLVVCTGLICSGKPQSRKRRCLTSLRNRGKKRLSVKYWLWIQRYNPLSFRDLLNSDNSSVNSVTGSIFPFELVALHKDNVSLG